MKISVIVPVYNVAAYLPECLDSLAAQTWKDLEVILVNDGSTDESGSILEAYCRRYANFRMLNKPNGGLSDARNYAIPYALGDAIAFLDSDDYADPDYYAKMAEVMEQGYDVVVSDLEYFYEDQKQPAWIMKGLNPHSFDSVKRQAFLSPMFAWNKLYRKVFFAEQGFRYPVGTWYEDIPVTMPIFALAENIGTMQGALIHYRQREGSIMSVTKSERLKEIFPVMASVRRQFEAMGLSEEYHDELEYLHIEHLRLYGMFRFLRSPLSRELLGLSDAVMRQEYPNWKHNRYLKNLSWKNRLFLKTLNRATLPLYRLIIR